MELTKIFITAILACVLTVVITQYKPEFSLFIKLACVMVISIVAFKQVDDVFSKALSLIVDLKINKEYIYLLFKAIVIAVVGKVVIDICNDSGNKAIATCVEFVCQLSIIFIALPLIAVLSGLVKGLIV